MAVKPNNTFKLRHRGYDIIEVDTQLRLMQEHRDAQQQELERCQASLQNLQTKHDALAGEHSVLKEAITLREKTADEITRIALKEANLVVETAQKNADSILRESLQTARQILIEMTNLGNEALYLRRDVKKKTERLFEVIESFKLPLIPSLDCLDLHEENEDKDAFVS